MHHRAIGQHRQRLPLAHDARLAQRDADNSPSGTMPSGWFFQRLDGAVVIAVEGTVVDALGLEEDHRIIVLDRGDQQALGIIGRRRNHRLEARDMGEQRFRALAVGLPAENAAAKWRAHSDRRGKFPRRAITQPRGFGNQLVEPGIDIVRKLDLGHRAQAIGRHAHGCADNAAFVDRRIEHARLPNFCCRPAVARNTPPK